MRTWGRVTNNIGEKIWAEVSTDANGYNDAVWLTTLVQTFRLNLGESPFYADRGIPSYPSVVQQIAPDYYVAYTQKLFSQYFTSLTIAKISNMPPTYQVNALTNAGSTISLTFVPNYLLSGSGQVVLSGAGQPIVIGTASGFLPT
jgi:hypothetical protein